MGLDLEVGNLTAEVHVRVGRTGRRRGQAGRQQRQQRMAALVEDQRPRGRDHKDVGGLRRSGRGRRHGIVRGASGLGPAARVLARRAEIEALGRPGSRAGAGCPQGIGGTGCQVTRPGGGDRGGRHGGQLEGLRCGPRGRVRVPRVELQPDGTQLGGSGARGAEQWAAVGVIR